MNTKYLHIASIRLNLVFKIVGSGIILSSTPNAKQTVMEMYSVSIQSLQELC